MQTQCRLPAIQQQPTRYPERRMGRRNRRSEPGNRREEAGSILKPENQEPKLGVHDFLAGIILLCRAFRGRVGDRVYKTYGDKIIVTRVPHFDGYEPSAAQRDRRAKMRAATAYARAVYADPAARAVYVAAAKQLRRQPFRLAVSDFLHGRPRVTLAPASHETTKAPKAPRTPAAPRRKSRSDLLAHCVSASRAKRARDLFRVRFTRSRRGAEKTLNPEQSPAVSLPTAYPIRACRDGGGPTSWNSKTALSASVVPPRARDG